MSNPKTDIKDTVDLSEKKSLTEEDKSSTIYTFYGSKLFVKCFGWFIFITFINILLAAAFGYFYHYKPAREEFERIASRILANNGLLMAESYEKHGSLSFARFRGPGNFWLFDDNLVKLFEGSESERYTHNVRKELPVNSPEPPIPPNNILPEMGPRPVEPPRPPIFPDGKLEIRERQTRPPEPPVPSDNMRRMGRKRNILPIDLKPPLDQQFKLKYKNFYKENSDKILNFAKTLLDKTETSLLKIDTESFFGCQILSDDGNKYIAIIHIPSEMPGTSKYIFFDQAKNMFPLLLIVCAILCFLMARYLAKPIVELQEASRRFANGDFSKKSIKSAMTRYDEIGDLAKDFNNMAERIEAGINSQKRLFHDISHELRSPLARMQVGIELLQMKVPDSEKSLVNRLEKDVTRMNALIEEVLEFSKLENKQIGGPIEEVELGKALENVCSDAEFESKNKHKGVKLEIKQECSINGNSILIERAFENIIRNGLRFTPENTMVEVSLEKINNEAVVKVLDHGPGVPEDQIERIFAPFYCIKSDRNPQSGGIGLGLSIALKAIEVHNGNIKISNREEGGLLVTITLPIE